MSERLSPVSVAQTAPGGWSDDTRARVSRHAPVAPPKSSSRLLEPYRSQMSPHWRYKTPELARESAERLYAMFEAYLLADDLMGAQMACRLLGMGARRARAYGSDAPFMEAWRQAEAHRVYGEHRG